MNPRHTPPVTVRMPDDLRRWVEQQAAETDSTCSYIIRQAVRRAMRETTAATAER
mgnify:CR=1 FL=1